MAKFKSFRTLAVAAGIAAVTAVPLAWAAGMFSGLPIAGGASYCSSFSGTGSGTGSSTFPGSASGFAQVCNVTVPAGPDVSGTYLIPADTQALQGQSPQTVLIPSALAGGYNDRVNRLIGGDFATNPWQRGTSFSAITPTTSTMTADRWAVYSSGNTVTVTKQTGASDTIPSVGLYGSMRVSRPSGTNTTQICVGQVLDQSAAQALVGNNGVFSFYALAGAALTTVANNNVSVYVAYYTAADSATPGTNTDAFMKGTVTGYTNVVGGGSPSPATTATVSSGVATVAISTTWTRYSVYATIPTANSSGTAVTGAGVKICYTPASGTGGSTEWFEIAGAQLQAMPSTATVALPNGVTSATAFERRPAAVENVLAQNYSWVLTETNGAVYPGGVLCTATANAWIALAPPTALRMTPTVSITAGGFSIRTAAAVTGIGTTTLLSGSTGQTLSLTSGAACTSTLPYQLVGTNTTGSMVFTAEP